MMTDSNETTTVGRTAVHEGGRLHVVDRPGDDPAVVLMHGFPDDHVIYDRLSPKLSPLRVVAFDWLGYGASERPPERVFRGSDRQRDLTAVIQTLGLNKVVLVGHDASGPEAVGWALQHPDQIEHVILLNTYYGHAPALHFPEMIRLLADPELRPLADAMLDDLQLRLWLLGHTARRFGLHQDEMGGIAARSIRAQFFGGPAAPDAVREIRAWAGDLFSALDAQALRVRAGEPAGLGVPVSVIFGARDEYLTPDVAHHLAGLFRDAEVHLLDGAGHWPQWDQPDVVARKITERVRSAHSAPAEGQ